MSRIEQLRAKLQENAPHLETGRADAFARGFEAIVSRALDREPIRRYASAEEMAAAMSALRGKALGASAVVGGRVRAAQSMLAVVAATALTACAAAGFAYRTRPAPRLPALQAAAAPAARSDNTSNRDIACAAPSDVKSCLLPDGSGLSVAPSPKDGLTPPARRAGDTSTSRDQRTRDADLLREIRRAVAEESYMTIVVPSPDELPPPWGSEAASSRRVFSVAGR